MNKERLKFGKNISIILIALVLIISMINNFSVAVTADKAKNLWDLYNATTDKEAWYGFNPSDTIGNSIADDNINYIGLKGAYCIDNHTGHVSNANYRIVNIIDINNNTSANSVKVYSEEHPNGVEYSASEANVKPYLMVAYLAKNNNTADLTRVILNNTYNSQMKNAGLSKYVNAAGYGADLNYYKDINAAYQFATKMASQGSLETASLSDTMTKEEKENVTVMVDGGKTYIGPYKVNLSGGCKIGTIEVTTVTNGNTSTQNATGISTDLKTVSNVENIVDAKEFYVVLDKEVDEIKTVKVSAKEAATSLKARLLITSAGRAQNMIFYNSEETKAPQSEELEVPKFGKLQIVKKDEFDNSNLNLKDIGFVVWSVNKQAYIIQNSNGKIEYVDFATAKKNEFKTNDKGETVVIDNLPVGKYRVFETSLPSALQEYYVIPEVTLKDKDGENRFTTNAEQKALVQVKSGQSITVTAENKRAFTNFYIDKIDKLTGTKLNGIEFKMYKKAVVDENGNVTQDGGWVKFGSDNKVTSVKEEYENATPLVTGITGVPGRTQTISKLPVGTYVIYETGLGEYEDYYDLGTFRVNGGVVAGHKIDEKEIKANKTGVAHLEETNLQEYITITGNVWEEVATGKNQKDINSILGEEDNRINGIEVRLIDKTTGNAIQTTKTAYDNAKKLNGVYTFKKVKIANLANYYVEFTYDGVTYQSVVTPNSSTTRLTDEITSKANETENSRNTLNNAFTALTGEGQKLNYNNNEITLSYTKESYDTVYSNNISDRNKGLNESDKVVNLSKAGDFTINSITTDNYLYNKYKELQGTNNKMVKEISNVNLGLYVREQPNVSLVKDVSTAEVTINGKSYVYNYERRLATEAVPTAVGVVFERKNPLSEDTKYKTPVYRADAAYENADKSRELNVYITYKVGLVNNSQSLYTTVNDLKETYSKELEFTRMAKEDGTQLSGGITEVLNGEYKTYTFRGLNIKVKPQTTEYVYLTFKLPKEQVYNVAGKELNTDKEFANFTEIASYTVYSDGFNKLYAGFDTNSIPNNLDVNNVAQTMEDDSDKAPTLRIEDAGQRTLSGIVFEDSDKDENDQERIGDGKYLDGENKIANVKVRLLDSQGNEAKVYDYNSKEFVDQTSMSNENGEYTISGFIPGDYTVQYTWGEGEGTVVAGSNKSVTVDSYKSTIWTDENRQEKQNAKWYLQTDPRFSDALDNYEKREIIDQNTSSLVEMLKNNVTDLSQVENKATMQSNTNTLEVGVELQDYIEVLEGDTPVYKFDILNVDLGLIERPRQTMDVEKHVDTFKVVTDAGQVLIEAGINNEGKWEVTTGSVTGGPDYGYVKGEMDTDLINSGTTATVGYKVLVKNTSEKDYESKDYYLYGIADDSKLISLKASGIYDYLGGLNAMVDANNSWEVLESKAEEANKDTITQVVAEKMTELSRLNTWSTYKTQTGETLVVEQIAGDKTIEKIIEFVVEEQQSETKEFKNLIRENRVIAKFNENGNESIELKPGESKELTYFGETKLSSDKDISFENDVEIVDVQKTRNSGRSVDLQHSNFYETAEWVTITPPTGENKDYTTIIIISVAAIAVLGAGVVIIKKVVSK